MSVKVGIYEDHVVLEMPIPGDSNVLSTGFTVQQAYDLAHNLIAIASKLQEILEMDHKDEN